MFAVASSPDGVGGMFINELGGTIIDGRVWPSPSAVRVFRVDATGRVYADGGFQPNGADLAETMAVAGDRTRYEPGDLLANRSKWAAAIGHNKRSLSDSGCWNLLNEARITG